MSRKKPVHYVDNKQFLEAFKRYLAVAMPLKAEWKEKCEALLAQGVKKSELPPFERPNTPDYQYIGECLLKIAQHVQYHPWYSGYTFREEMVGDALENCIRYLENYDPEITKNPFAYFTQVMMSAFQRRKDLELKHDYIKQKSLESAINFFATQSGDSKEYKNTYVDFIREVKADVIKTFEEKKKPKNKNIAPRTRKTKNDPKMEKFMVSVEDING